MTSGTDSEHEAVRRGLRGGLGFPSIGVKLALAVFVMLGAASLAVGYGVSALALRYLVEGKEKAAVMVVDAACPVLAPALDFGDDQAIAEQARRIKASPHVTGIAVWNAEASEPILALPHVDWARPDRHEMLTSPSAIRVARAIENPSGVRVGYLAVEFSLAPEISRFQRVKRDIYLATGVLSLGLALLVIGFVRVVMLRPLVRLLGAMSSLSGGKSVELDAARRDEMGRLARGFNDMARSIADREQRLEAARERTQELLDHMHDAILVFDVAGNLLDLRSRRSEALFGAACREGPVAGVLFPDETTIEHDLFEQWRHTAFELPAARFAEIRDLAPFETRVRCADGKDRLLMLEFTPIARGEAVERVMVLCTDVTEQRRLERAVEAKDAEHEQQMHAMRTLVAGGGQLLVNVLRRSGERIEQSRALLRKTTVSRADVDGVFQLVHTVKGEARVFEQAKVMRTAANLECELGVLRDLASEGRLDTQVARDRIELGLRELEAALHGSEALLVEASPIGPAILDQVTVRKRDLDELLAASVGRRDRVAALAVRLASRPFGESLFNLPAAVSRWADTLHKRAVLDLHGRDVPVSPPLGGVLSGVVTHLVRNAVAHGIEGPLARSEHGKPAIGVITVSAEVIEGGVRVIVSDDGQGADPARLGQGGLDDELFEPGTTTAGGEQRAADLAGRGMGLPAVRADLARVGYRIRLINRPGDGLTARIEPEKARSDEHQEADHPRDR
jgi:two-component system chemotaxis sensor kinase CheA